MIIGAITIICLIVMSSQLEGIHKSINRTNDLVEQERNQNKQDESAGDVT